MNKEQVLEEMLACFNKDNITMAEASGMPTEEIQKNLEASQSSLIFMFGNIYDLLVSKQVIKNG